MVTFDDLSKVRNQYGLSVDGLCGMLRVKAATYYNWKKCGISQNSKLQPLLEAFVQNTVLFIEQHASDS